MFENNTPIIVYFSLKTLTAARLLISKWSVGLDIILCVNICVLPYVHVYVDMSQLDRPMFVYLLLFLQSAGISASVTYLGGLYNWWIFFLTLIYVLTSDGHFNTLGINGKERWSWGKSDNLELAESTETPETITSEIYLLSLITTTADWLHLFIYIHLIIYIDSINLSYWVFIIAYRYDDMKQNNHKRVEQFSYRALTLSVLVPVLRLGNVMYSEILLGGFL